MLNCSVILVYRNAISGSILPMRLVRQSTLPGARAITKWQDNDSLDKDNEYDVLPKNVTAIFGTCTDIPPSLSPLNHATESPALSLVKNADLEHPVPVVLSWDVNAWERV